jgi:hypothetical protein
MVATTSYEVKTAFGPFPGRKAYNMDSEGFIAVTTAILLCSEHSTFRSTSAALNRSAEHDTRDIVFW